MKLLLTLGIVFCCAVFFFACSKDKEPVGLSPQQSIFPDSKADVYIVGYSGDTLRGEQTKAMYWKNGHPVELTDGTFSAKALSVAVSGHDVYVCGWMAVSNIDVVPVCWKNGILMTLPGGNSYATSVVTSGNDVYICGNGFGTTTYGAKYWKNGITTLLPNGALEANAICLQGADFYICGSEYHTGITPVLWKNGNAIAFNDSSKSAYSSIAINGGDIYIAGYERLGTWHNYVKYWKNGIGTILDTTEYGRANKIMVAGNDVYITGYHYISDNNRVARYWKNGTCYDLGPVGGVSDAASITEFNNSLYIVGSINHKGAVWINGSLFTTMDQHTYLTDIKVVPK